VYYDIIYIYSANQTSMYEQSSLVIYVSHFVCWGVVYEP